MPLVLENELLDRARLGGPGLERLIAAVWPEAYRIAFSILRDRGLAEDAAQEACASIARSLPTLKSTNGFAAWSYRIITNHAISAARQRPLVRAAGVVDGGATQIDRSDALDIEKALAALPVAQRSAILLHYYAGLTSGDIAAATGLPASTIRFHLMLARRSLRRALSTEEATIAPTSEEAIHHVR